MKRLFAFILLTLLVYINANEATVVSVESNNIVEVMIDGELVVITAPIDSVSVENDDDIFILPD